MCRLEVQSRGSRDSYVAGMINDCKTSNIFLSISSIYVRDAIYCLRQVIVNLHEFIAFCKAPITVIFTAIFCRKSTQ